MSIELPESQRDLRYSRDSDLLRTTRKFKLFIKLRLYCREMEESTCTTYGFANIDRALRLVGKLAVRISIA